MSRSDNRFRRRNWPCFEMRVVVAGLALLLNSACLLAKTVVVGAGYEHATISAALSSAAAGDTVVITTGLYREHDLLVDRKLTVLGHGEAILDGELRHAIMTVKSDSVVVRGLHFVNAGVSFVKDNAALRFERVVGGIIDSCRFDGNFFGIYLADSRQCRISNNVLRASQERESHSGNGIHLWKSRDIAIAGNTIVGHRDGIYLEFVRHSEIQGNQSRLNRRYGLHFMYSDSCIYTGNTFRQNGAGVAVMYTKGVTMLNNEFADNWGAASYGLLLKDIADSRIAGNRFLRNTVGIFNEGSTRIVVEKNEFRENGWALKIMANCVDNNFTGNNFIANAFQVATNGRRSYSTFAGNYWSNYEGYDLDRDGIGDIPFRPVSLYSLMVERMPGSLILLRSLLTDVLDLAERVLPSLTPETFIDAQPHMRMIL